MKNFTLFHLLVFAASFALNIPVIVSQPFVDMNSGIEGVHYCAMAWGDYDNDKDADLLISGQNNSGTPIMKIYNNDNGVFSDINAGLLGTFKGNVCWIDYDNDGDLDILATGENMEDRTLLYNNESGSFVNVNTPFDYFGPYGFAACGDYDNDGDPDVLISGNWNTFLYKNNGSDGFSATDDVFASLSASRAVWSDFDRDGDADLLITGDTGGGMKLYLYLNNNGQFEEHELGNMGLSAGSIDLGDYDSDGDLDILITGFNSWVEPESNIYRNDGNLDFTNIYAGLAPVTMGRACWGDADNDGDLDLALSGRLAGCGAFISEVYINDGNDFFSPAIAGLTNAENSYIAWGDVDNDTDLDLILAGDDYSGNGFTTIYRNEMSLPNFLPDAPENLSVSFDGGNAILSWDKATDIPTPQDGLSYNLRIGTSPLAFDNLSPMAHMSDGFRKITAAGNVSQSNSWKVSGLKPGVTYYWSVQAIDNSFAAGAFSEENSFTMTTTGTSNPFDQELAMNLIYPNPSTGRLYFDPSLGLVKSYEILSQEGKIVKQSNTAENRNADLSDIDAGLYFIRLSLDDKTLTQKLILR